MWRGLGIFLLKREELLQEVAALQEALQGLPPPHPPPPLGMKVFAEKNKAARLGRKHATSHEFLRQVAVVVTRKEELEGHLHQVGAGLLGPQALL